MAALPGPFKTLEVEREGPVLRVWLNRPERRNAVANTMLEEVGDCFRAVERDFETRIVVLGGRGLSFCAGMDRKPAADYDAARQPETPRARRFEAHLGRRAARAIEDCEALTIARVHGHAIGGGFVFALACDFRVASDDARFSLPEVDLGVPLSWAGVPRLIQEVGMPRARELLLRCREIDASTAEQWGVLHSAVPAAGLDAEVGRFIEDLLAKPETAVHMTKTQLRGYARLGTLGDATEADGDLISEAARDPAFSARMRGEF